MTAPRIVDPATVLGGALADASPDLMRHLLQTRINALLSVALVPSLPGAMIVNRDSIQDVEANVTPGGRLAH